MENNGWKNVLRAIFFCLCPFVKKMGASNIALFWNNNKIMVIFWKFRLISENHGKFLGHIQKVGPEIWGFWWDLRLRTHLMGETWDASPSTLKVGPETWDSIRRWDPGPDTRNPKGGTQNQRSNSLFYMGPKAQGTERGTWNPCGRWNLRPKNLERRNYDPINLIKCPRNGIWVMICLIFNHIIKRLQYL